MDQAQLDQTLVHYQENGIDKSMSQSEAIALVEQMSARDPERALHFFHKLWSDNPNAGQLHWRFYATLTNLFLFDQLLEVCDSRLSEVPNDSAALIWKIEALSKISRHNEAIELLEKMVAGDRTDFQTLTKLGAYHKQMGQFDKALWCFNRAIEQNHYFTAPYWLRADICEAPEENLAALQALIASKNCPQDQQKYLHFAAYRYAERLDLDDQAFQHLQLANSFISRSQRYDVGSDLTADKETMAQFSTDFLAKFAEGVDTETQAIFIIGLPRSGRSLVEQIISSHRDVSRGGNTGALANAIVKAKTMQRSNASERDWLASRHQSDWAWIGRAFQANTRFGLGGKRIVTDSSLSNNRLVGVIKLALPNAKIISVDRHPLDLSFGIYRQLFEPGQAAYAYQFKDITQRLHSHNQLMAHWKDQFADSIYRQSYENLVANPQASITALLEYCGLSQDPACFEAHSNGGYINLLSTKQVRAPIFDRGVNRWRRYESQLSDLHKLLETPSAV